MITPPPDLSPSASPAERIAKVNKLAKQLRTSSRPIMLGPWRSELGFEMLYWLPFLTKLASLVPGFDKRAVIVTRGGLAPLYSQVAAQGYDLYALRSVTEVRRESLKDQKATGIQKQLRITDWDRGVIEEAAQKLDLSPVHDWIHPAWMYWSLDPYWEDHVGLRHVMALTEYRPVPVLAKPEGLPEKYVAVRFYARHTFPYPDHEVQAFVMRVVGTVTAQCPVVVLGTGSEYDDHADLSLEGPNLVRLDGVPPEENLKVQAAILQHATAFVGTYGGVAQLALRLGVPSVSFWKQWSGTAHGHLGLSSWLSKQSGVPFCTGSLEDAGVWQQTLSVTVPAPVPVPQLVEGVA